MSRERDLLELSLLYDTACGFLSAHTRQNRIRHALLSMVGCAGARFAAHFTPRPAGGFECEAIRGLDEGDAATLELEHEHVARLIDTRQPLHVQSKGRGPRVRLQAGAERDLELAVLLPLVHEDDLIGVIALGNKLVDAPYNDADLGLLVEIGELTARVLAEPAPAAQDTAKRRKAPASSAAALRKQHPELATIEGDGPETAALFEEILTLAPHDFPVLILGETGTGKELVARALHALGPRRKSPFEAVNCAAIPRELIASTLFGHERGAFTGAVSRTRGAFELAGDGTLFLDEIGDMPLETQSSLLRVLQEKRFRRVGSETYLHTRSRVVSATNVDLRAAVESKSFRADLFYRLQVYCIRLKPLRERRGDVPGLVRHVLARHAPSGPRPEPSAPFVEAISAMELPGNVRELESLVLGALMRASGAAKLEPEHLPTDLEMAPRPSRDLERGDGVAGTAEAVSSTSGARVDAGATDPSDVPSYEDMERNYVRTVLQLTGGNKKRAAEIMGIPRTTLNARIRKLGL